MRRTSNVPADFASVGANHDPAFLRGNGIHLAKWRRKGALRTIAVVAIVTGAAIVGGWAARRAAVAKDDPRFTLRDIRLEGVSPSRRGALEAALAPYLGRNLLSFDLGLVRAELDRLPWIENASLAKQLPSGLVVRVHERPAVAFVVKEARLHYLSSDGQLLGVFERGQGEIDLPVVVGDPSAAELVRIGGFLDELGRSHADFARRIGEIRAGDEGSLVLFDPAAGCDVIVQPETFAVSFARWLSLWPEISKRFGEIESADLRFQNRIVLKPALQNRA